MKIHKRRADFEKTLDVILTVDEICFRNGGEKHELEEEHTLMTEFIPEEKSNPCEKLIDWEFVDRQEVYDSISKRLPNVLAEELIHEIDSSYSTRCFGSVFPRYRTLKKVFDRISFYARENNYSFKE